MLFVLTAAAQVVARERLAATTNRIAARAGVAVGSLREGCVREVAFHLSRRPGTADPDGLARTLVHAVDGLLHHAPAVAGVQRERVRELARLVAP
nr:hypothetical protein [Pseudonocardia sp. AL041005-10]